MRSTEEWISKHDDQRIPDRVRLRVWMRANGCCQICERPLGPADKWDADHIKPLRDGGFHRETNLQVACEWCHSAKTSKEAGERATVNRKAKAHAGIKRKSRPMDGSRASKWKRKMDGTVERR